jgi:hypothetical protein
MVGRTVCCEAAEMGTIPVNMERIKAANSMSCALMIEKVVKHDVML